MSNVVQDSFSDRGVVSQGSRQVVFVDNTVKDWAKLVSLVPAGVEVRVLDTLSDGLGQMGDYLASREAASVDSLILISHGGEGRLQLGATTLDRDNLDQHAAAFQNISHALSADADWLIYGCDVASGSEGLAFVQALADLSGADVAASSDLTGVRGNWDLEVKTGEVAPAPQWVASMETAYAGDLAVTHTFDSGMTNAGSNTATITVKNTTSNVTVKAVAANGVWRIGNDSANGFTTTYSGNWAVNEAGTSSLVAITVDSNNDGSFGDPFSLNSFKLSDTSFNGGTYTIKPNGLSAGQETILLSYAVDAYSTFTPTTVANFNSITGFTVQFDPSSTGITLDDFDFNTAPTITSGATASLNENAGTSTVVYTATATDAENNAISYSLSGTDAGSFTIISSTGVVRKSSSANYEIKNSYRIDVVASDGTASSSQTVTVSINDVNEAPVFSSGTTGSVAENAPTSTVVYTAAATDPESGAVTYSLSGTDAASFTISPTTGALTLNSSANYEAKTSYSLNVLASDGVNTALRAVTVSVTNVNEKPVITAPASQSVNQGVATALTGISVADPDSGANPITVSLSAPAGTFTSTTGSGVTVAGSGTSSMTLTGTQTNINSFITASKVTYTTAAGATGTVTLSIGSNDGGNSGSGGTQTDSKTETLNITMPNAAPTITSGASGSVAENDPTSTVVYSVTATDPEGDTLTYALTGTDAASFTVDTAGAVRLVSSADYETKSSYSITVNAMDATNTTTKAVTVNVTDVNEAPVFSSGATGSVAENAATTTVVYTAAASDPEAGAVTYSLSGTDAAAFTIDSNTGAVRLNASADYETKNSYSLSVVASDASSNTASKAVTINVTNVNEKPVLTVPASQNVTQETATAITGISVADPDSGSNPITISLSAPAGTFIGTTGSGVTVLGSGTTLMTLTGTQSNINAFVTASKVTYTTAAGATGTVTLSIGSNDGGNSGSGGTQTDSKTETLNIVLPNAAPVITSGATGSVAENAATTTVVYTATATDAENDAITYSLTGADAASFSVDSSGQVRLLASADYETKSSYSITVNAKDATNTTTKAVTVNVTDVNEAPTNVSVSASSVAENTSTASALTIGSLTSTDPDTGNTFTYSIVGGADQASFQITGAALQFKAGTTLDYETQSSYAVTVRTTDQGGLTYDKALTITLTDANDKPVLTAPATANVPYSSSSPLSGISVADQDAGSNSISVAMSVPSGTFTATSGGGVTVAGSGTANLTLAGAQSAINSFLSGGSVNYVPPGGAIVGGTVTLSVVSNDNGFSGGGAQTDSKSVTLTLIDPNQAPVITSGVTGSIAENAPTTTIAYATTTTDAESDAITYSLTGTDAAAFSVDSAGAVRLLASADFETKSSYSITVNAQDATHTTTKAVTVNVTDVNETPTNVTLSASSVVENTATAVTVGALSSTDPDAGETFTYSVVGGADQASFQIAGSNLQFKAGTVLDFETKNSYAVTVRATDHGGLFFDKSFNVSVTDANDPPLIAAPASRSVWTTSGSVLLGISVSDQDAAANAISLQLNVTAGTLKAVSGNGVAVSGSDSATISLVGPQSAINTFIANGNLVYIPQPGAPNGGTVTMTLTSNDGGFTGGAAQSNVRSMVFNLVDYVAPAGPGPVVVPAPTVTTNTIDGVSVSSTTSADAQGKTTTLLSVPVVTPTRVEDQGTTHQQLADIPLVADGQGQALISVGLPVGVGLVSQTQESSVQTLRERLVSLTSSQVGGNDLTGIVSQGIDAFVGQVADQQQVSVREVSFLSNGLTPGQSITVSGTTGLGESDAAHPLRQEALVIDARSLPAGTVINLDNVEFGVIVGAVRVEGGNGKNFVVGDGQNQFILLGPEDDVLRGGAGDDTVASKGGNDQLYGDDGNDRVIGGQGNDQLYGGNGNDLLQGGQSDAGTWHFMLNKQGKIVGQFTPQDKGLADLTGPIEISQWRTDAGQKITYDPRVAMVYRDGGDVRDVALLYKAVLGSLPETKVLAQWAQTPLSVTDVAKIGYDIYQSRLGPSVQALEIQVSNLIKYVWGTDNAPLSAQGVDYLNHGGSWADALLYLVRNNPGNSALLDAGGNLSLSLDWKTSELGWSSDAGNDQLSGDSGNDVLVGGRGNNVIDGGEGTDLAVFFGGLSEWSVKQGTQANQVVITNIATGESNQVSNVELFEIGGQVYRLKSGLPTSSAGNLADFVQAASSADIALIGVENWLATQ